PPGHGDGTAASRPGSGPGGPLRTRPVAATGGIRDERTPLPRLGNELSDPPRPLGRRKEFRGDRGAPGCRGEAGPRTPSPRDGQASRTPLEVEVKRTMVPERIGEGL